MKKALITGVLGQDGSLLAEMLVDKGYLVYGVYKNQRVNSELKTIKKHINFAECDMTNMNDVLNTLDAIKPDEIYNFAAQSSSVESWDLVQSTYELNAISPIIFLEAIRKLKLNSKFFQASSSEIFGFKPSQVPQNEDTKMMPQTPYSAAKAYAQNMVKNYREHYGMFAVSAVFYNHESERRSQKFITKKIATAVVDFHLGEVSKIEVGNLDAKRDWGYAVDYVYAAWLMLQAPKPEDYIVATGKQHTIRNLIETAFNHIGIIVEWQGGGLEEIGLNKKTREPIVLVNKEFYRKLDIIGSVGNADKICQKLGWSARTSFEGLVANMIDRELYNRNEC